MSSVHCMEHDIRTTIDFKLRPFCNQFFPFIPFLLILMICVSFCLASFATSEKQHSALLWTWDTRLWIAGAMLHLEILWDCGMETKLRVANGFKWLALYNQITLVTVIIILRSDVYKLFCHRTQWTMCSNIRLCLPHRADYVV